MKKDVEGGDPAEFCLGKKAWVRALERTASLQQHPHQTFPVMVDELADRFGHSPALISDRESLTFQELAERANQYSRWALEQELAPGTVVGLMMPNRPEYLAIWLGITRIGCSAALLNPNLMGASLAHCIDVVGARHLIMADDLCEASTHALALCKTGPEVWVHGESHSGHRSIRACVDGLSGAELQKSERREVTLADRALCIFTSGTTGLPKAANVSHHRIMAWGHWFAGMMDARPADRLYNCLPLYHATGGVAATAAMLSSGGSVFIKERFSARCFWEEVCEHECTVFQYIGELCRYLVNAPASPHEREHRLRLCCGNGLGGDIWQKFKERFRIPHILEFYAATEANFSLYNVDEEPGAIGRIPAFLGHRFPVQLIKMNVETLEPVRNEDGLCIPSGVNEVGEAVSRIGDRGAGASSFEGYTSAKDSEKKILRGVLAKGDEWFRSGDLMRRNERGFFYFVDRIGETFRWKGENVSTSEVMQVISACPGVTEATVFGVALPNAEGRAGMAALSVGDSFDLAALKAYLDERLPRYSQPLFLRMIDELELTSTFKPRKADFILEGCDPKRVTDQLFFNDQTSGRFVKLTPTLYGDILMGRVKL